MADKSLTLGTLFTANAAQFVTTVTLMKKKVGELNAAFATVGSKGARGVDKATRSVDKLGRSMDKASTKAARHKKALRGVAGALDRIRAAAKITAAFAAAAAAITAVTAGLREGLSEIIAYDQGLKNLQAITNATDQEVAGMGETIKDVARTTKFSTAEVAEGMVLLGQAGFSAAESMQAMQSVSDLATGTLSSMQFTTDLMTTTIRAFGMSTVESAKAADIMANAINRSKLTIDKLRIAFNFVGAASHQAGLTLEETAASMMVLANQGLRASTIGTGLRQVLSRLLAPTGKLRAEFEANNIELKKVNPSLVGFRTALQNLLPVLYDQADGTVDMAKAYQLFGLRGAQAVAVLTSSIASGVYDKMLDLTFETGTAARMAATQIEGLGLKVKNLADRARLAAVALGEAGFIGALGAIIDALKMLATGIERFIASGIGQIIVAFTGWTIAILASAKALQLLIRVGKATGKMMLGYIAKVQAAAAANTLFAASAKKGVGVMSILGGAGKILSVKFMLVIAAVAAVVVAIRRWITATERRLKVMFKEQAEITTQVQTIGLYIEILDKLAKKQSQQKDITDEHTRAVRRMNQESKDLIPTLKEEVGALDENRAALEAVYSTKLEQAIQNQVALIKLHQKEVEEAKVKSGLWAIATKLFNVVLNAFGIALKFAIKWIFKFVTLVPTLIAKLIFGADAVSKTIEKITAWLKKYGEDSDTVKAKNEEVRKSFVDLAKLIDREFEGKLPFEDIVKEAEKRLGQKVDVKTLDAMKEEIEGVALKLKEEQSEWKANIDQLPVYFQEMYKDLDGLRKANFAKAMKSMQAELAGFDKFADQMNLSNEERSSARAAIRAKHLVKFASDLDKEKKLTEESYKDQLAALDILDEGTEEMFHRRTTGLINHYLKQTELAKGNSEKLLELEKKFGEDLTAEHKKLNAEQLANDKQRQELTLQMQKQTVEKLKDLHKQIMEDLKSQLQSQYKAIKGERDAFLNELASLDKSYQNTIRGIRQKTMTDEQRWNDDRKHAHELMNKANATGDSEMFKEAMSLAAGLAREVQDENGEVVKTIERNSREAERLVNQIHTAHKKLIEKEIRDRERQMRSLKDEIVAVDKQIVQFGKTIDAINAKEMVIKADKTIAALEKVYKVNNKFKEEWEDLEDKTIVLTIKYNYVGKQSGGSGGGGGGGKTKSEGEGGGETSTGGENKTTSEKGGGKTKSEQRWGGLVEKMMAAGGKLGGYGGGDKVKAMLEPGEYVIRKEAVKKYGGQVFEGLNNMTTPNVVSNLGKRLGGMIGDGFKRFQFGGNVPAHAALQANQQTFNINLNPKYLTGDRQAMRSMAKDVSKAVEEQSRRWGVK